MPDKKDSQLTRVTSLDGTEVIAVTLDPDGTPATRGIVASNAGLPVDDELLDIAALSPSNDDILQRKSGAWTNRTPTQVKTDLSLVKGDVGLGNVDNTSDATKNAATATLTNKTLTSPVINTPTGIVKGDVGLGNVTNDAQLKIASNLSDLNNAGTARTNLGLAIGSNVQAFNEKLDDIAALVDPNADRLLFWDDSAGEFAFLTLGDNLSITGTTLNASGGGGSQTPLTADVDADGFSLLFDDSTGIKSSEAGNPELLLFSSVVSAINEFLVTNAAAGNGPILSATGGDSNININLTPKGNGKVVIPKSSGNPGFPTITIGSTDTGFQHDPDLFGGTLFYWTNGAQQIGFYYHTLRLRSDGGINFVDSTNLISGAVDSALVRAAAGLIGVTNGSTGGAGLEFTEVSDFANAGANKARLYLRDNGSGKGQLVVIFPSGAVQILATEP